MAPAGRSDSCFVALDFETANTDRSSACAVGLVTVVGTEITDRATFLIRPPQPESGDPTQFQFCHLHGICRHQVADQPTFADLWPQILERLEPAGFVAAHNAPFDRSVLMACCEANDLIVPPLNFLCTVELARSAWRLNPANLPAVCEFLSIPLDHHRADSDAEACARIVIAARQGGVRLDTLIRPGEAETPYADATVELPAEREIIEQLDRLGELRRRQESLKEEERARILQAVPPKVKVLLTAIYAEFTHTEEALPQEIKALEEEVKEAVLHYERTVKGRHMSAIWNKGRTTWDTKELTQYGQRHPEIFQFQKQGKPHVSIRSTGHNPD